MMTDFEDFIISAPYTLTDDDKTAIANTKSNPPVKKDWDKKNKGIKAFKENIKEYLYGEQNGLCAYCRCSIERATSYEHIEHIVDKNKRPEWMFVPENLCVACAACNSPKNDHQILTDPTTQTYPVTSAGFIIVNPFLDKYSEHIELVKGLFYKGKTDKGKTTVDFCHLYRADLTVYWAKKQIREDNQDTILYTVLSLLQETPDLQVNADEVSRSLTSELKIWKKKHGNAV